MERDAISEVGIDALQRLYVLPQSREFQYIYREAMEVHWDQEHGFLYAPSPPRSQLKPLVWWFNQILAAAKAQSCELCLTAATRWQGIPDELRQEIIASSAAANA
jgi:hypothetical protein